MNLEDREAENTQDELDGTSDGVSGQELASVRSLARGREGGGGAEGKERCLSRQVDLPFSDSLSSSTEAPSFFFPPVPSYFLRHIRNFRAHTSVFCRLLKEFLHMVYSVCNAFRHSLT